MTEVGEWHGQFCRVPRQSPEIGLRPGARDALDEACNIDMRVTRDDGQRRSGAVFTLEEVDRIMKRWHRSGDASTAAAFMFPTASSSGNPHLGLGRRHRSSDGDRRVHIDPPTSWPGRRQDLIGDAPADDSARPASQGKSG
jgi:hypothetical protein